MRAVVWVAWPIKLTAAVSLGTVPQLPRLVHQHGKQTLGTKIQPEPRVVESVHGLSKTRWPLELYRGASITLYTFFVVVLKKEEGA